MKTENQVIDTATAPETDTPEVKNSAAILKKNKELLAKLAETTTALKTAQDALKTAQDTHATTAAQLRTARIEDPLAVIVKTLSPHPGLMTKTLKDLFDVELDASGQPVLMNKDGAPLTWQRKGSNGATEDVAVRFERDSMADWCINGFEGQADGPGALMFKAQGTGAPGANRTALNATKQAGATTPAPTPVAPISLGLR